MKIIAQLFRFLLALALVLALLVGAVAVVAEYYVIERNEEVATTLVLPGRGQLPSMNKLRVEGGAINVPVTVTGASVVGRWVRDVHLHTLALTIPDTAAATFDFLESIELRVKQEGEFVRLCYAKSEPEVDGRKLEVELPDQALDAYLRSDTLQLTLRLVPRSLPQNRLPVACSMQFSARLDIF